MGIIRASDTNFVRQKLFDLMGTTATGYGVVLLSEPVQAGELITTEVYNQMYDDLRRSVVHQYGPDFNTPSPYDLDIGNMHRATTATIIQPDGPDRLYTNIQFLTSTIDQIHPSQVETMRVNTYEQGPPEWVSHWTANASNGYMCAVSYTWFYPSQLNYFFNLGSTIQPEITISGPDRSLWLPMVNSVNRIVFGKTQFDMAQRNGGVYQRIFTDGITTGATSKAVIARFTIIGSQLSVTVNFLAGYHKKGKKGKGGKWGKKKYWSKKDKHWHYKKFFIKKKGDKKDVNVRLRITSDFVTRYSIDYQGGIDAPIPQSQLMSNCLSAPSAPIPPFVCARGELSQTKTINLRNNTSGTCIVYNISLLGYTTGTVSTHNMSIAPYGNASFDLNYTGAGPGLYRGYVKIETNINNLTLFTEVNVGAVNPQNITLTTTTNELIVKDFYVDYAGGNYRSSSVTMPSTPGYTLTPYIPEPDNDPRYDGFRVEFNPHGLSNGLHATTATVTIYPVDSTHQAVIIPVPIRITTNIQYQQLGNWASAQGHDNSVVGLSYDIIGGVKYVTIGVGSAPTILAGGVPNIAQLHSEDTFTTWADVYRIPITGHAQVYRSTDSYLVKQSDFDSGNSIGWHFGVGDARNALCTLRDDGHGNISIEMNAVRAVIGDANKTKTLQGIANAFYYYDPTSNRINQLEYYEDLEDYSMTHYFTGFDRFGKVTTTFVDPN